MKKISIITLFILALLTFSQQASAYYVEENEYYTTEVKGTGSELRIHIPLYYNPVWGFKYRVTDGVLKIQGGDKEAVLLRYSTAVNEESNTVMTTLSTDITGKLEAWSNGSSWETLYTTSSVLPIAKGSKDYYDLELKWAVPEEWFFQENTKLVYSVQYASGSSSPANSFSLTKNIGQLKRFIADPAQYEFAANGNTVQMKIPFYDKWGKDSWVNQGVVKVKADGKEETLFTFVPQGNIANANMYNLVSFTATADSTLYVHSKTATSDGWIKLGKTQKTVSIYGDDLYYMELRWDIPAEWLDKDLEFVVQSDCKQNELPNFTTNVSKTVSKLSSNYYYVNDGTTPAQWNGTPSELAAALGDTWVMHDGQCVPVLYIGNVDAANGKFFMWDDAARLILFVDKYVGNELRYTQVHELDKTQRTARKAHIELNTPCVDYGFRLAVERGNSVLCVDGKDAYETGDTISKAPEYEEGQVRSKLYFDNNVKLVELKPDNKHSEVHLNWTTNGGDVDYFKVYRRDQTTNGEYELLADQYLQSKYVDKKVLAFHVYEYKVVGVVQCEGEHEDFMTCIGQCHDYGRVSGYARMANGTAIAGKKVIATPSQDLAGVGEVRETYTDDTGYYVLDNLIYLPGNGHYTINVETTSLEAPFTSYECDFAEDRNEYTNVILAMREYYIFSGVVLYEGSSIPVPGAQFLVDGKPLYSGSGERVQTNSSGEFSVSLAKGNHTVQVVKEGHTFLNDGYYLDPDSSDPKVHNWQRNIAGIYLYDETKVKLRGRMVGGEVEGDKPLGQSLSKNNLGRDLKMVMQLEGDNTSFIVFDPLDRTITERKDSVAHGMINPVTRAGNDTTRYEMTRHTITIHPDVKTGEYELMLYPVKYKVTELSCIGYPTLFQQGKVGETLDLTGAMNGSTVDYKCVYHNPATLSVKQLNSVQGDYYGESFFKSETVGVGSADVPLWSEATGYTLGHPAFLADATYLFELQAQEEYRFENRTDTVPDVVRLKSGTVYFNNNLVSDLNTDSVQLDTLGHGLYQFQPKNMTFLGTNENALRTLSISLLYDGSYYDIMPMNGQPLRAFVMGAVANEGVETVTKGNIHLIDILRDPPGSNSYSYIESGSKWKYSYTWSLYFNGGVDFEFENGTSQQHVVGAYATSQFSGLLNSAEQNFKVSLSVGVSGGGGRVHSYELNTTERIQTSSDPKWIGPDADLYIGMTDNLVFGTGVAVRMVNEQQFEALKGRLGGKVILEGHKTDIKDGTVKVLATGKDAEDKNIYLISDEVITYYPKFESNFIYSGRYIEKEMIPELLNLRNERIMAKDTPDEVAQNKANAEERNVYVSLVDFDDKEFAYHDSISSTKKNQYIIFRPKDKSEADFPDEIKQYNEDVNRWYSFLALNERDKVQAQYGGAASVKNYSFDGAANIQYSESYSCNSTDSRYMSVQPIGFDGGSGKTISGGLGKTVTSLVDQTWKSGEGNDAQVIDIKVKAPTSALSVKVVPVLDLDWNWNMGRDTTETKKTGFVLNSSVKSNLSVGVYRSRVYKKDIEEALKNGDADVFLQTSSETMSDVRGLLTYLDSNERMYGNFIFKTLGGATSSPWEDERKTKYYAPGTVYDQKTVRINQLHIWADQSIVSNVPYGEPARFKINICNESPMPDQASPMFTFLVPDSLNPGNATVRFNGNYLNGTGYTIGLNPGEVITKEVEVYAGSEFDYDNIGLTIVDPNDILRPSTARLSAHFVPSAGKINVSTPGDKWVVNTESPYDSERQFYYMPVRIDGFDVNYRNFDHIELQYKLSTQGDKDWVNVCSYYKDEELMAKASGECQLIQNDGFITARFYGEKDPVEQYYDLRAVVYCRHGNGFLTSSSPILSGVKDTRRPQVFGNPKPLNGILGIGDDICITFSEPIASNYLSSVNNFEVLGMTNSSNITQGISLQFPGHSGAFTTATRDLSNRSFCFEMMIDPAAHTEDECILIHGELTSNEPGLQLGLTKDNRLMAMVKDQVFYSNDAIPFNGFNQIAYVFDTDVKAKKTQVRFYDGSKNIGTATYDGVYDKMGQLIMGSPFYDLKTKNTDETTTGYKGNMLEFRLWNKALTGSELSEYGQRQLTGYELGLTDNYPMNEGKGDICYDKAVGGADLYLVSATWNVPAGLSLKLDGQEGVPMNEAPFTRSEYQDYTLMFWFKTAAQDGTLLANGEAKAGKSSKNRFNIGVAKGVPYFRSGNKQVDAKGTYVSDDKWHHLAVTMSRSRNVGNLYIDYNLVNTFSVDTLGGIIGGHLTAGATYENMKTTSALKGYIDELAMYEMSLPVNVIKEYATTMPTGKELGTMVYLPFNVTEMQQDHSQRIMPSGVSIKQTRDNQGNFSLQRDTIISEAVATAHCDREYFAPINNTGQRENLKFSYVADKQNLLLNLDEPDANLEKTKVYITVSDVADLNGNLMASPVMMELYVYRNPLRWSAKQLNVKTHYGETTTIEATITNQSGRRHNYTLEQLPVWITASQTSGTLEAMGEETITLTISPYINIGDYSEKINLVDEEGMNEPLSIHIEVRGEEPEWTVSDALKSTNITMNIIARVKIDGQVANDPNDIIAVFGNNHETLGTTHLNVNNTANGNEALTFLTVYNYNSQEQELRIEYYDASSGQIYVLMPADSTKLKFQADKLIGSTTDPLLLVNSFEEVQPIQLKKGWNWISFYVVPKKQTVKQLLNDATKWEVGDALETTNGNSTQMISYKAVKNKYNPTRMDYFWDNEDDLITIDPTRMYRFYSVNDKKIYIAGEYAPEYIDIKKGWNRVAYNSKLNLPIASAMADYTDRGTVGDIIKSQDAFAVLTADVSNNRSWKGNLTHLQSGQGYMIQSGSDKPLKFRYPIYSDNTRYSGDGANAREQAAPLFHNATANTMNIIAQAAGIETQEGDRLLVFRGAEMCGMTEINSDELFFLSVGDTESASEGLSFAIEREGEVIAVTGDQLVYRSNMVMGTVNKPTVINFATVGNMHDGQWYDMLGRKLVERPTRKGVYIYNGQKTIVE